MSKKKKIIALLVLFGVIAFFILPPNVMSLLFASRPAEIGEVHLVEIRLLRPYSGEVLYEGTVTEAKKLNELKQLFMEGSSQSDHKCASLGGFKFMTPDGSKMIEVLPGHHDKYYEFRYDEKAYRVNRKKYISVLKGLAIPEKAIVLDGHPSVE